MAGTRTLTIIKPDAFSAGRAGQILAHLEKAGFKVIASRVMRLTEAQ
ncbi:MAG TPA: nucleoside-diphosphate kinase, partial [Gemmatimonadaceae bacterium]